MMQWQCDSASMPKWCSGCMTVKGFFQNVEGMMRFCTVLWCQSILAHLTTYFVQWYTTVRVAPS